MGMRGTKSVPTAVRIATGTLREDRHGSPDLAPGKPLDAIPEPPVDMAEAGREKWHELLPLIRENGYLADLDLSAFTEFCRVYDQLAWIDEVLAEHGEYEMSGHGWKQHPAVNRRLRLMDLIRKYHQDFWLNPTARAGKQIQKSKKEIVPSRKRQA